MRGTLFANRAMYKYQWPETPVPTAGRARFPASAAFLETPSIMTAFCGPKEIERAVSTRVENNFPKAFSSFLPSNLNSSKIFDGNTSLPLTTLEAPTAREVYNRTPAYNGFNLNCTLPTIFPDVNPMHKFGPLTTNPVNRFNRDTSISHPKASSMLMNYHQTRFQTSAGQSATVKRKFSPPATGSKYVKPNTGLLKPQLSDHSTAAASKPDSKGSLRIVSGTIEHILKIIREQPKTPLLLETVASVLAIRAGSRATEKVLLLRNRNVGPVLQAVYYEIDTVLTPLAMGDRVRCVGRLQSNGSRFQILKITHTTDQYERAIVRLQTVSTFTSKVMR